MKKIYNKSITFIVDVICVILAVPLIVLGWLVSIATTVLEVVKIILNSMISCIGEINKKITKLIVV